MTLHLLLLLFLFSPYCVFSSSPLEHLSNSSSSSSSCKGDACALLHFKSSIWADPFGALSSWTNNISICKWKGVTCDGMTDILYVTELNLSEMELEGVITPHLSDLAHLNFLDLSSNYFSANIPPELSNCSMLAHLDLGNNSLSGQIPSFHLPVLTYLRLSYNQLTGIIPSSITRLSQLKYLSLSINELSGEFPPHLTNFSRLLNLTLGKNRLTGEIPASIGNLSSLTELKLSHNQFRGSIPSGIGLLKQLRFLALWDNQLTGRIPSMLGNCTSLQYLKISENLIVGGIPPEIAQLNSLVNLNVSYNRLSGRIPQELSIMPKLIELSLSGNFFQGEFPTQILNISQLQVLFLDSNSFNGSIPEDINRWPMLYKLHLSHNQFASSIPSSIAQLSSLGELHLQGNMLSGTIPDLARLSVLVSLDLSSNKLSGSIPNTINGNMGSFSILNLSHNQLNGSIPIRLGSLMEVQKIDLSYNNLSGNIPIELTKCKDLVVLNLSNNQLEGDVPNEAPFNNKSIVNLEGNVQLCGDIVHRLCKLHKKGWSSLPKTYKYAIIILIFIIMVGITFCAAYFWFSRRNKQSKIYLNITQTYKDATNALIAKNWLQITEVDIKRATNNYDMQNIIGSGAVSTVYIAVLQGGKEVAIKLLNIQDLQSYEYIEAQFKFEVHNLAKLRHRNLVRVLGCCFNENTKAIILEYMCRGNLDGFIHSSSGNINEQLTWESMMKIIHGIAHGLLYLHHECPHGTMIHCDIKPSNILLGNDLEPRISDFGISRLIDADEKDEPISMSTMLRGSFGYFPPEYGYTCKATTSGDIYSFGVLIMEMLTGQRPTSTSNIVNHGYDTLVSWVHGNYPLKINTLINPKLNESIHEMQDQVSHLFYISILCTQEQPSKRPIMTKVLKMLHTVDRNCIQVV